MNRKVTVVGGAGNVGATVARCIADKELADVVIVDIAGSEGPRALPPTFSKPRPITGFGEPRHYGADYADGQPDVVVIMSGVPRKSGHEPRRSAERQLRHHEGGHRAGVISTAERHHRPVAQSLARCNRGRSWCCGGWWCVPPNLTCAIWPSTFWHRRTLST